jgi:hypothetical protein
VVVAPVIEVQVIGPFTRSFDTTVILGGEKTAVIRAAEHCKFIPHASSQL